MSVAQGGRYFFSPPRPTTFSSAFVDWCFIPLFNFAALMESIRNALQQRRCCKIFSKSCPRAKKSFQLEEPVNASKREAFLDFLTFPTFPGVLGVLGVPGVQKRKMTHRGLEASLFSVSSFETFHSNFFFF